MVITALFMSRRTVIMTCLALTWNAAECQVTTRVTTYLGTGYNLLSANPEGSSLMQAGLDPGLNPTKQILQVTPTSDNDVCPVQATCAVLSGKTEKQKASFVDDTKKYKAEYESSWSIESSISTSLLNVALQFQGSASQTRKQVHDLVVQNQDVLITNQNVTLHADATYNYRIHQSLTPEFLEDLRLLADEFNSQTRDSYFKFLRNWGTHVIVHVRLGEKYVERTLFKKETYLSVVGKEFNRLASVTFSAGVPMFTVSSKYTTSYSESIAAGLLNTKSQYSRDSKHSGSREAPVPISMKLLEIPYLLSTSFIDTILPQCIQLSQLNITRLRRSLTSAIVDFMQTGGHNEEETTRTVEVTWPKGTYSLLKSKRGGCPFNWDSGYRFQDTENYRNINQWSNTLPYLLDAQLSHNIGLNFCTKRTHNDFSDIFFWGAGSYCIFKKYSCPAYFKESSFFIEDEDWSNSNSFSGILPDGVYDKNTRYDLCCRNDAGTNSPLLLPTQKPFFLLPVLHTCQTVLGMSTEMHYIKWDSEDNKPLSRISGQETPRYDFDQNKNYKVYFCYYYV